MRGIRLVAGGGAFRAAVERQRAVGEAVGTRPAAPSVGHGLDPGCGAGHLLGQPLLQLLTLRGADARSLGWSRSLLNGALSLGLLATGAAAYPVGAWIDRRGGRTVMTLGSLLGGLLLFAWAQVETPWAFYLIWALIGASLARVLYERLRRPNGRLRAGRPARHHRHDPRGRLRQHRVHAVDTAFDWDGGLAPGVAGPRGAQPRRVPAAACPVRPRPAGVFHQTRRVTREAEAPTIRAPHHSARARVLGLAVWFTAANAAASGFVFQFVPLLTGWGVDMAAILTAVALIGPMQVAGRVVLMGFSARLETREIGTAVAVLLPAAVLALPLPAPHARLAQAGRRPLRRREWGHDHRAGHGRGRPHRPHALRGRQWRAHPPDDGRKAPRPVVTAVIWSATGTPSLMLGALLGSALVGAVGFILALSGTSPSNGR